MKRNVHYLLMTLIMGLFAWNATAQVTVAGSVTGDGPYTTLGAAIAAIPLTGQTGNNITIAISASTTEASTGITIGAGNWSSLKIYPTATVTLAAAANTSTTAFIILSGANNVTIDGRLNRTGASSLTINNVSTAGTNGTTAGSTISFTNSAQNDSIKYCTIQGRQAGAFGIISFSATATLDNGNGLNVIDHNVITPNSGGSVLYGLYAIGNVTKPNIGNKIINNEFKNLLALALSTTALNIVGGLVADAKPQNDNYTISGNSFYHTGSITTTSGGSRAMLVIGSAANTFGGSHTITDNYIGSTAANCAGGIFYKFSKEMNFSAISIFISPSTLIAATSIQNNTIQKINWQNNVTGNFQCIVVAGTGDANIGTITGNTIGDNTTTGSLTLSNFGTASAMNGISITTTGTTNCQNNKVGSMSSSNGTAGVLAPINGISKAAGAGNTTISYNIIGSTSKASSISTTTSCLATLTANQLQTINGITCTGSGTNIVSNNTIANITNKMTGTITTPATFAVTASVLGITCPAGANTIGDNTIYSLKDSVTSTIIGSLYGIQCISTGTSNISKNTISNFTSNALSGNMFGMYVGAAGSTSTINGNLIHSLSASAASTSVVVYGIQPLSGTATVTNNIIKLGDELSAEFRGISDPLNSVNTKIYHNTVYIGGAPTSLALNSYALYSSGATNIRDYRNNILVNTRSNNGATGKHYAMYVNSKPTGGSLTVDFNDYISSGASGAVLGFYAGDISALPIVTQTTPTAYASGLDASSLNIDPRFIGPETNLALGFFPRISTLNGADLTATVPNDYAVSAFSTTGNMGAYQWNLTTNVNTPSAKSSATIARTTSGVSATFDGTAVVELYTVNGKLIERTNAVGSYTRSLNNGLYIIRINGKVTKFVK